MEITVNSHASIRVAGERVCWFDPFQLREAPKDGQIIFITHDHFDHFSPEDIARAAGEDPVFVVPVFMAEKVAALGRVVGLLPGERAEVDGVAVEAVAAYNPHKKFHPREKQYLGYVVTLEGQRVYVCGDTDVTDEALAVRCDVVLCPVGGTYTMTPQEAAGLCNAIRPRLAIPTHYGSGVVGSAQDGETFRRLVDGGITVKLLVEDAK